MRERTAPLCHRTRRTPVNNHESIHQRRGRSLYFPSSRGQLLYSQYCSVDCGWKAAGWAAQRQELISLFTLWFYLDLHFLCPLYLKGSHHPSDCSVGCFLFFSSVVADHMAGLMSGHIFIVLLWEPCRRGK